MLPYLIRPFSNQVREATLQAHDRRQHDEADPQPQGVPVLDGVVTRLTEGSVDWAYACAVHGRLTDWHVSPEGLACRVCVAEREALIERDRYLRATVEAIHA